LALRIQATNLLGYADVGKFEFGFSSDHASVQVWFDGQRELSHQCCLTPIPQTDYQEPSEYGRDHSRWLIWWELATSARGMILELGLCQWLQEETSKHSTSSNNSVVLV